MKIETARPAWFSLVSLWAMAFAAGCATQAEARAPVATSADPAEGQPIRLPSGAGPAPSSSTRPTSCPLAALVHDGYDLSLLRVFSRTLFYVRENSPVDLGPRARELVVGALEGAALQETGIVVEADTARPPRWVSVTVSDRRCTLNLDRVDAPWSLRSTVSDALRFVQGNLGSASRGVEPAERMFRIEIAATNGMLSALDGRSVLLDVRTDQKRAGPSLSQGQRPIRADGEALQPQEATKAANPNPEAAFSVMSRRMAPGSVVAYARLASFGSGVSAEVERWLAKSDSEHVKGLILDLRDNTGGLLDEAVKVADAFIKEGSLGAAINNQRGSQRRKELVARNEGHEPGGPLVVLVNHRTASAAELVAAAIKNLGRGLVMGEPTAGRAAIRVAFDVPKEPQQPSRSLHAASDRDIIQDVISGKAPTVSPPPPVEPEGDRETLALLLLTGRLLASGGAEIEGVGVAADVQPTCLEGARLRPDDDCLLLLAQDVIARARDPLPSTLLSIAREVGSSGPRPRPAPP